MGRSKLDKYESRRDFRRTSEPTGEGDGPRLKRDRNPIFVVQEHDASRLHYDFRLEIDGVLESWAVPKGPSTDPREKRLAVRVEAHPLDYADFEGVIAEGEYGAGSVIVWDAGAYKNIKEDEDGNAVPMERALEEGGLEVWLEGKKIRGGYALVHSKVGGKDENWLLIKMKDDAADARRDPVSTERESVLSGRTVEDVRRKESGEGEGERDGKGGSGDG
ncbi:MAG: DNA polymerase ligase N-terminal domain-containing protein [Phycisphaerales bacterium]